MFRGCGGFFPLLLTFFIVAAIFVSTLNATSHQELSAAPREKRYEKKYFFDDDFCSRMTPQAIADADKTQEAVGGPPACDPKFSRGDTSGAANVGYGSGLMVAALFAYLFLY